MKIKMLKTACGPQGSFQENLVYTVDDELAEQLINGRAAKPVEEVTIEKPESKKPEVATQPQIEVETATEPTTETKPAKPRGKYRPGAKK